jgi:hypothetical protein
MSKALQFIQAVARKLISMRGEGIASIGNKMQAEAKAGEIAAMFQESGLPLSRLDQFIRSEKDVIKYLNIIEESKKTKVKQSIQPESLMKSQNPADVFDLKGNRIKNTDNIMGGQEIPTGSKTLNSVPEKKGMSGYEYEIKNPKKDPALYEDRGENIIPAQFKDTTVSPERVAQGFSTQMKLNNAETNKRLAQDLIQGKSSEFNNLTMEAKSDIINKINIEIKKEPQKFYQGGQAQIEPDLSGIGHGSDALMARNMLIAPGSQATTSTGLNYLLGEDNDTTRVPYKEKGSVTLADLIKVNASGSKSGKNQIMGAPDGITADTETFNAIIKMDIPIMEKINLLGSYGYGKDRFKVEKGNKELFLGEDGYKDRNIGLGFNQDGEGLSGSVIRNLETGDNDYQLKLLKSFAEGGRIGYKEAGPVVLPKPKPKPNADPLIELQRIYDLYQESMPGVSQETQKYLQQDFIQKLNDAGISQEQFMTNQMQNNFANGGPARQNFKMGKRAFLKLIGGVGAGIAGIKTGLLGLGKKTVAKSVIAPAAQAANEAGIPPYFFKLVNKIKSLGDDATPKYANQPRETVTRYKDYELTEHLDTGQTTVRRFKQSEADYYDEPLMEEVYMSHRPGEMTEGAGGKFIKTADEYVEDTSFLRTGGGNKGEVMDTVDGLPDDLLEELGETIVKKADGGRIGYKLGKKVIQEGIPGLIKKVNKLFGKEVVTTADKLPIPKKTLDRDMFNAANKRLNKKRQLTDTEIQDYEMELGDSETWMSEGTLGEAENALKNQKAYQDDMYQQYKMGKLDPVAGDKSPARKKFLQQKFDEMEGSGDKRLMTRDEIEELSTFDLGTQMDQMKEVEINKIKTLPKIDDKLLKNYIKEIKAGVEDVMRDTSPAGLEKSIEIDNLMLKYPGLSRDFADQIASSSPTMKADMIAMVKQTFKMSEQGMSGDDIIQTFKNTPRTKQATGGLASILGE